MRADGRARHLINSLRTAAYDAHTGRMLPPGIAQCYAGQEHSPLSGGMLVGRGVAAGSYKPPFEDEHARHLQQLEDIRLVGYRYLKPPGVTKTLRTIHEDEAYAAGASTEEHSLGSEASSSASEPRAAVEIARSEDNSMLVEDEESDDAPDFTLPALNASFPSLYYQ